MLGSSVEDWKLALKKNGSERNGHKKGLKMGEVCSMSILPRDVEMMEK